MPRKPRRKRRIARPRSVAGALRTLREGAGLSQKGLAQRLGHSQHWVYSREAGVARVAVEDFARWVRACGGDPQAEFDRLMDGS